MGGNLLLTCAHVISLPLSLSLLSPDPEIAERSSPRGSGVSFTCSKFLRCNFTAIVHAIVPLVSAIAHYVLTCRGYFYYYINYTIRPRSQG